MKFASMLRRLRSTQGGIGSSAGSSSTPYMPYTDPPPDEPTTLEVTVTAGSPTVSVGNRITFTGSVSNAPDGVPLTHTWTFDEGATDIQGINGLTPSCNYTTAGKKTVRLTVSYPADGQTVEAFGEVTITVIAIVVVPPLSPVADAGSDQFAAVNKEVSFDGSGSTSPSGGSLKYSWAFGDDATPATVTTTTPQTSCTYGMPGTKRVTLTVTDEDTGLTDSDTVTITVIDVGVMVTGAPRVVAAEERGRRVTFTGTVSNAPESATLSYSWSFDDSAIFLRNVNGLMPSCQYITPGDKTVTLTVGITIGEQTVEVEGTCVIRVFKVDAGLPQVVAVGDTVDFIGAVLDAPAGVPPSYSWDFDDGMTNAQGADGLTPSCSYTTTGNKTVTLTVSFTIDGESIEGSGTVKITVLESQLRVQGPRALSDLEREAFNLVFGEAITPPRIQIYEYLENAADPGGAGGQYDAVNDIVEISIDTHAYAEDMDGDTTVDDIDLTIPNNIKYLATLIHEVGHHWQSINNQYNTRIGIYEFDNEVLGSLEFVCKEQHAAVGQVYFILKWQLHHGHDPINITQAGEGKSVGPVNRYTPIADIPPHDKDRHISRSEAMQLINNFNGYLADLRQ